MMKAAWPWGFDNMVKMALYLTMLEKCSKDSCIQTVIWKVTQMNVSCLMINIS